MVDFLPVFCVRWRYAVLWEEFPRGNKRDEGSFFVYDLDRWHTLWGSLFELLLRAGCCLQDGLQVQGLEYSARLKPLLSQNFIGIEKLTVRTAPEKRKEGRTNLRELAPHPPTVRLMPFGPRLQITCPMQRLNMSVWLRNSAICYAFCGWQSTNSSHCVRLQMCLFKVSKALFCHT